MGVCGSRCRRSAAAKDAAHAHPAAAVPPVATASSAASSAAFVSGPEELRRRGIRPKAPGYRDTPLLTIGKQVRVLKELGFRRALIEYVDEADGTVDVAYEDGDGEDETIKANLVRPLEGFEEEEEEAKPKAVSTEEKRQLGVRPNEPAYSDTPLLSVGKAVRVQRAKTCRRAEIECISAGQVDVVYRKPAEAWPGASVYSTKLKKAEEETVPAAAVKPLEDFEVRKESVWKQSFSRDFYGTISALKDGADELFIELKDHDAAVEYYSTAISKLRDHIRPSALTSVLVAQDDKRPLVLGRVNVVDVKTQKAFVALEQAGEQTVVDIPLGRLIPIHTENLVLQGSLYMNRARVWMQLERGEEALRDLSIAICLGSSCSQLEEEQTQQLAKAHVLRGKIRLSREESALAREDVKVALDCGPPKAIADAVWQLYRDVEKESKAKTYKKDIGAFSLLLSLE